MSRDDGSPHVDREGRVRMVDVGEKDVTARRARAEAYLRLGATAWGRLVEGTLAKGDAWAVARVAGIQAAKRTPDTIPLCHAIPLDRVSIEFQKDAPRRTVRIVAEAAARARTGVEMEAMTAASTAALTLYDMLKGLDRGAVVERVRLLEKAGGKSGNWSRSEDPLHREPKDRD